MKTVNKFVLSCLILLFAFKGFSQNQDTITNPNEDIRVNKEFDENGNLIRYDSTYVYTWSSDSTMNFKHEKIMEMRKKMEEHMQKFFKNDSLIHRDFKHPFFDDTFFKDDFFEHDFFNNEFFKQMEKMMEGERFFRKEHNMKMHHDLDSLHKEFMKERKEYFRKRDSILRKHKRTQSNTVDI
jgi:hypothetical protein